jgi:hypothetical protein
MGDGGGVLNLDILLFSDINSVIADDSELFYGQGVFRIIDVSDELKDL